MSDYVYNVIIPLGPNNIAQFNKLYSLFKKNLGGDKIIVLCSAKNAQFLPKDVIFIDESTVYDGMSLKSVGDALVKYGGNRKRAGWYFQQFLKMSYAMICDNRHYLIWDADTVPAKKLVFFSSDGRILFNRKEEHHTPYFETIKNIFLGEVTFHDNDNYPSFISEGMMIDVDVMTQMIRTIECNAGDSVSFWEYIIASIKDDISGSGFSEFETYGNYLLQYYPEKYKLRYLRTCRLGYQRYNNRIPSIEELEKSEYDTVSFEAWDKKTVTRIIKKFLSGIPLVKIIVAFKRKYLRI